MKAGLLTELRGPSQALPVTDDISNLQKTHPMSVTLHLVLSTRGKSQMPAEGQGTGAKHRTVCSGVRSRNQALLEL